MKLRDREYRLKGKSGEILIQRKAQGVPEISASTLTDAIYGQGWMHAHDRQLHMLLTRILLQGKASEKLADDPALVEVDRYMRHMDFSYDMPAEKKKLSKEVLEMLDAYCAGVNDYLTTHGRIFEFRLLGYEPEPYRIEDIMILTKIFGFMGLADAQGNMEKLLVQMVQKGVDEKKLRELFPYLKEKIDYPLLKKVTLAPPLVPDAVKWLDRLPKFNASNNWVVSGRWTKSGKPILCADPHLEVNRMPSVWYEMILRTPDNLMMGVTIPGMPGIMIGRTNHVAWSATYSFMDQIDFRIEECRDGKYRRGAKWVPFAMREEKIITKKGREIIEKVYENEHGILEGDPYKEGYYLVYSWSGRKGCGANDVQCIYNIMKNETVKDAMKSFRLLDCASFNWVMADTKGNIGYQMSGRLFNRPAGVSGLVPLPGWEKKYDSKGFVKKELFPARFNPAEGYIITTNQDLNKWGKSRAINLPMGIYRAERIERLLKEKRADRIGIDDMKAMHYDLYSTQAERFMEFLRPRLPATQRGRLLGEWDCRYDGDSVAATIFENVYFSLLMRVFGDNGFGRDTIAYLLKETSMLNDYYGNFDDILLKERSAWFGPADRDRIVKDALDEGLDMKAKPYAATRRIVFSHLLFGGKLPSFFGFDYGPVSLPGSRATIPQGQIFRTAGRVTTFSPSYRMVTDMSTGVIHTCISGGSSDRRTSPWYTTGIKEWLEGTYKTLG